MEPYRIKVLVADDDKNLKLVLETELKDAGRFEVATTERGRATLEMLEKREFDVLLLDLNMPDVGGMEVLKRIREQEVPVEVIILTGHGTISTAVEAMKLGAYDFLSKPFKFEELKAVVEKACEKKKLLTENLILRTHLRRQAGASTIVSASSAMQSVIVSVGKFALSNYPVLITGESGVGKELVARAIHDASPVAEGAYVPINCGAIPENMIESELFGYEKGAFTGAHARKPGLLEIANGGTLFLDEIGDMPLPLQVKLLRVIETGRFFRLGGTREIGVSVRIISATNKDLKQEIEKGRVRQDLYYRIATLTLHIPPLRERKDDILPLIEHTLASAPAGRQKRLSAKAISLLQGYQWPGNVRELQNIVHRAVLLSREDEIDMLDLPSDLTPPDKALSGALLEDIEKNHILKVLKECNGHRGKAAEVLGIDPKTLYRKLQTYGIKE